MKNRMYLKQNSFVMASIYVGKVYIFKKKN